MESLILDLRRISYKIGGKMILNGISWQLRKGEHWAILGPNGAGKTTLLKIACGYLWPNGGGTIYRNGQTLVDLRQLRESIGWVTASLAADAPDAARYFTNVWPAFMNDGAPAACDNAYYGLIPIEP